MNFPEHQLKPREAGFWSSDPDADARLSVGAARQLALTWVIRLRYGLIAGEAALIAGLFLGLHISLPEALVAVVIAIQTASNWILRLKSQSLGGNAEHVVGALFALDTLCLTLILGLSGGPRNPFSLLYLVQITFSAVVLRKYWTWALGILSSSSFGLMFWFSRDVAVFHDHAAEGFSSHLLGMWVAFATAALLISFFVGKLSTEARIKERDLLLMQKRLSRSDRLASLVTLSAGAAHEMATPLATIAVTAKEMEHDATMRLGDSRVEEDAKLIRSQVERCRLILERMGAQGADPFGEAPKAIEIAALLYRVREKFPANQDQIRIEVADSVPPDCILPVRAAIEALCALVKNALDASPGGKPVLIRSDRNNGGWLRFSVCDEGTGMSSEILERVVEPFFTTKGPGSGMGLGAFLVHLFAQTLGGQLTFESAPGRGCTAILELPGTIHVEH